MELLFSLWSPLVFNAGAIMSKMKIEVFMVGFDVKLKSF